MRTARFLSFARLLVALGLVMTPAPGWLHVTSALGPFGTVPPPPSGATSPGARPVPGASSGSTKASPAGAPRPELIRRIVEFEELAASNPVALPARFAHPNPGTVVFDPMLAHDVVRSVPFVWRSFFSSALTVFGPQRASGTWVGFYNPLVDLWLMTEWMDLASPPSAAPPRAPGVTRLWMVAGEALRDAGAPVLAEPAWRESSKDPPPVALLVLGTATLRAAHAAQRTGTLPGFAAATRGGAEHTSRTLRRLVDFNALLLFVDADGVRQSVATLRASLADGGTLTSRLPSLDPGDAARVAALPVTVRNRFEMTSIIPTAHGMVLTLGIPRLGRWVLVAQYLDAPPNGLALRRLVLVDVGATDSY